MKKNLQHQKTSTPTRKIYAAWHWYKPPRIHQPRHVSRGTTARRALSPPSRRRLSPSTTEPGYDGTTARRAFSPPSRRRLSRRTAELVKQPSLLFQHKETAGRACESPPSLCVETAELVSQRAQLFVGSKMQGIKNARDQSDREN